MLVGAGLAWVVVGGAPAPVPPPNVLVVVADDLGIDGIGAYGEGPELDLTPNVDRLAATGVVFVHAYANPVCSPSRALLLTGRYSSRTGIGQALAAAEDGVDACGQHELLAGETTLAELLQQGPAGYATAALGKWHLNAACPANGGLDSPRVRGGFQRFAGTLANFAPRSQGAPTDSHYFCWPKIVDGSMDCGGSCCTGSYSGGAGHTYRSRYATTDSVDEALAFLAAQPAAQPWFCYLALHAAHVPLQAPPDELHDQTLVYPLGHPLAGEPVPPGAQAFDLAQAAGAVVDVKPYQRAMVQALDRELGRLFATLSPDTLVVFVGDNGTPDVATAPPFDAGHAKASNYEGGTRVPLIVSGALVASPARTSDALVSLTDVFATVAELGGTPLPRGTAVDGLSFLPLLLDPFAPPPRRLAFTEYFEPNDDPLALPNPPRTVSRATLRNDRYKLVQNDAPLASTELYDLLADPFEQCDLVAGGGLVGDALLNYDSLLAELADLRADFP